MTIKVGDKFQTRDGQTAVIEEIAKAGPYPIKGKVNGLQYRWMLDGKYWKKESEHLHDLIIPPEPATTTIERDKTYKMRNGEIVVITATDIDGDKPILGVVDRANDWKYANFWNADGSFSSPSEQHPYDIMLEPERKSLWVNYYKEPCTSGGGSFSTRERANGQAISGRTHVLQIITENGEPIDVKIHKVAK